MQKRKWLTLVTGILLALLLITSQLLTGCSSTPATTSASTPPQTTAPPATTTTAPTTTTVPPTPTPSAADFYKGKNFTIMVGTAPGGGSDLAARLLATSLAAKTGANVVVVNDDAAAGMVARNKMATTIKGDGLTIMCDPSGALFGNYLMEAEGVAYDISKFQYVGAINCASMGLVVSSEGPYTTPAALIAAKGIKFGSNSPGTLPTMVLAGFADILKLDAKVAVGYSAASARRLALQQGEIQGMSNTIDTALQSIAGGGKEKVLMIYALQRDKFFPDVPTVGEFVTLTDTNKKLITAAPIDYKMFFAPPGTPQYLVDYLRTTIEEVGKDPAFQTASAKNTGGVWQGIVNGKTIQDYATNLFTNKAEYLSLYKGLMDKYIIK